jgi:2-keto-4-pentenoate hydratase/2-oxohepta-3-ene-1,7-dioic acid hydratase in catechol pathway
MDGDTLRDLSAHLPSLSGHALDPERLIALRSVDISKLAAVRQSPRIGACIEPGGKIVCAGLNYADHAREAGMEIPSEPVLFMKGCRLSGPNDAISLPAGTNQVDWEIELAIVIGRYLLSADAQAAERAIAGYATFIDVSERTWQMSRGGQWVKGKSWPSFAPLGPWLVTPDEVPDVGDLSLRLSINGECVQDGSTAQMIVGSAALVSYISRFMPLYPGDVIATGTPAGVGMGLRPPRYLAAGDEVHAEIDGLGVQRHTCR